MKFQYQSHFLLGLPLHDINIFLQFCQGEGKRGAVRSRVEWSVTSAWPAHKIQQHEDDVESDVDTDESRPYRRIYRGPSGLSYTRVCSKNKHACLLTNSTQKQTRVFVSETNTRVCFRNKHASERYRYAVRRVYLNISTTVPGNWGNGPLKDMLKQHLTCEDKKGC